MGKHSLKLVRRGLILSCLYCGFSLSSLASYIFPREKILIYSLSFEMLPCDHWKPDGDLVFSAYTLQEFLSFMNLDLSRHLTSEDPVRTQKAKQEGGTSNLSLGIGFLLSDASFTHY